MEKIYTVTLNPAIDRMLYLDRYQPEITNRLKKTTDGLGGKGTHVSLDLAQLKVPNVATGIVHGTTGSKVLSMLEQDLVTVRYQHYPDQETRTNYLMIEEDGKCTCLSSPGVQLTKAEIESFITFLGQELSDGDYLVFSGDASNCPDPYVYNRIMEVFSDKQLKVFIDASGETLKQCLHLQPYLIKPNLDELSYLAGRELSGIEDVVDAVGALKEYRIPVIAVSLGGDGSAVFVGDEMYRVISPEVNVCNTIGCGDCFLSGLIYGTYRNLPTEDMLRKATAIASACAESELSVGFDEARAREIEKEVVITKERITG